MEQQCHATATSGLHRSWWALVYARSGNRLHSVQPCRTPRARPGRLLDGLLPLRRRANASADRGSPGHRDAFSVPIQNFARVAERGVRQDCRPLTLSCSCGLWASLRFPVQVDRWHIAADSTPRHLASQIDRGVYFPNVWSTFFVLAASWSLDLVVSDQDTVAGRSLGDAVTDFALLLGKSIIPLCSPLRAVGVDAPSCLHQSFGAFAVDMEEPAREDNSVLVWF